MGNGALDRGPGTPGTVHPHAYGERSCMTDPTRARDGSSPRIWGTGFAVHRGTDRHRFIPTHMGNGAAAATNSSYATVHPHAYGERTKVGGSGTSSGGSSPRIWGTAARSSAFSLQSRFIPTHMGNGLDVHTAEHYTTVHPHAYGERPVGVPIPLFTLRFIPTHMGNGVSVHR